MSPHALNSISPSAMAAHLWRYRELVTRLIKRDVVGRYKGSLLGLAWSFVTPIIMLVIYTFVFTVVFNARWGVGGEESKSVFALQLFAGLIVHGILAEVLTRSPSLILANTNYVKKVVFPLDIMPLIPLGSALFHASISTLVLLLAQLFILGTIPWTFWMLPLAIFPLVVLAMGVSWFLASLGVFLRDIGQTMGLVATMLLFLSPIFYPISALPENFHGMINANPLTFIIEQVRMVLLEGEMPDWTGLLKYLLVSMGVAWLGFAWFQKTRKGFADVL